MLEPVLKASLEQSVSSTYAQDLLELILEAYSKAQARVRAYVLKTCSSLKLERTSSKGLSKSSSDDPGACRIVEKNY